jgi:uncharacterized peroxidase-related enzyme
VGAKSEHAKRNVKLEFRKKESIDEMSDFHGRSMPQLRSQSPKEDIMPRLATIDPANDTGPGADLLNGPLKEMQVNIFKGLASHPQVLEAFLGWSAGLKAGALSAAEHELLALHISENNGCEYCTAAHTMIAEGVGIDAETALDARRGEAKDEKQQALIDFSGAVMETKGFVSDAQLETFRNAGFGDDAVIEVLAAISAHTFTNLYNHVHATDVDFPTPPTV